MKVCDLTFDEQTQKQHPREVLRRMLHMTGCRTFSGSSQDAGQARDHIINKFWDEKPKLAG